MNVADSGEAALVIARQRMSKWQAIETAPKEQGARGLLYTPVNVTIAVGFYSVLTDQWLTSPGRYDIRPTHWMPLPDPPVGRPAPEQP